VSFRGRLTLFFLLIVVLPMIAVGVLVRQVSAEAGSGKADARLSAGLDTALSIYRDDAAAAAGGGRVANEPAVGAALRSGDPGRIESVAPQPGEAERDPVARDPRLERAPCGDESGQAMPSPSMSSSSPIPPAGSGRSPHPRRRRPTTSTACAI
jgi:hypothetical protein